MDELSHVGMGMCFFCGEAKEVLLDRRLKKSLPREAVYNKEPCNKCKELMKKGIMLISVRDGESGDNPYRTGKIAVITEQAMGRFINDGTLLAQLMRSRMCFVPDAAWDKLGLPKENMGERT